MAKRKATKIKQPVTSNVIENIEHSSSSEEDSFEDEEHNEEIEKVVSAYGIYETFCDKGETNCLYDVIQILAPDNEVFSKKSKLDVSSIRNIAKESIEGEITKICFTQDEELAFKSFGKILLSQSYFHLADQGMSRLLEQSSRTDLGLDKDIEYYFLKAIEVWPYNATARSVYANSRRMFGTESLSEILMDYELAAYFAHTIRDEAVSAIVSDSVGTDIKEFIEVLLLDSVGVEYIEDSDNFSFPAIEATSSFMVSLIASCIGDHDKAKVYLKKFRATHRVHPSVWEQASGRMFLEESENKESQYCINQENGMLFFPTRMNSVLTNDVYDTLCNLFAPTSSYWNESDYNNRGYYSYWLDLYDGDNNIIQPKNIIEHTIINYLLPKVQTALSEGHNVDMNEIVGAEWWVHHRPIGANLGHQLHFDTDEALLEQESEVTHPLVSSVLYLTGGSANCSDKSSMARGGSTIIFSQDPKSKKYAKSAYIGTPQDNSYMIFPGNLLHGVLPCPSIIEGCTNQSPPNQTHRLTFMVGFWTRNVPKNIKKRTLYSACGLLPPPTRKHTWVRDSIKAFNDLDIDQRILKGNSDPKNLNKENLPVVMPAWETIEYDETQLSKQDLEFPCSLNHRFFVKEDNEEPNYFWESLFQK